MPIDFLIIGQGLAGSLLAWELIQRDCKIIIVDNGENNASRIAAGLINPVTGQRFVKSANIDILLPIAKKFYEQLSVVFQQPFYIEKPMLRLFRSEQEMSLCLRRLNTPDYHPYLGDIHPAGSQMSDLFETPMGYVEQKQAGYLLTRLLLSYLKNFFIAKDCYHHTHFDYREIQVNPRIRWRNLYPEQIIFCEGFQMGRNPWFSWLPMQPVKGEILTLEHEIEIPDTIINYGHWLLPLNSHQIRIGATFDRKSIDTEITGTGKEKLLTASEKVLPQIRQAKSKEHQAGIRPCTIDRQPFVGKHPQLRQFSVFNGFGAKGSLLIPEHCGRFADLLLTNTPLPKSCDIQRFYAPYFTG